MLVQLISSYSTLYLGYEVELQQLLDQINCLRSAVLLVVPILELLEVGRELYGHVSVLVGDHQVETDVLFSVPHPLGQFVFFNVFYNFSCAQELCELQDLVDVVIALHEWDFSENLKNEDIFTIPANIMPAAQQSTR